VLISPVLFLLCKVFRSAATELRTDISPHPARHADLLPGNIAVSQMSTKIKVQLGREEGRQWFKRRPAKKALIKSSFDLHRQAKDVGLDLRNSD